MASYRFSEEFQAILEAFGAEIAWGFFVEEGGMAPWEFKFWAGFRGLV